MNSVHDARFTTGKYAHKTKQRFIGPMERSSIGKFPQHNWTTFNVRYLPTSKCAHKTKQRFIGPIDKKSIGTS